MGQTSCIDGDRLFPYAIGDLIASAPLRSLCMLAVPAWIRGETSGTGPCFGTCRTDRVFVPAKAVRRSSPFPKRYGCSFLSTHLPV